MVLIKYLGEFIEGLNEENVSVSVLSGEFEMKNPALKKAALDSLELPITVQTGENYDNLYLSQKKKILIIFIFNFIFIFYFIF